MPIKKTSLARCVFIYHVRFSHCWFNCRFTNWLHIVLILLWLVISVSSTNKIKCALRQPVCVWVKIWKTGLNSLYSCLKRKETIASFGFLVWNCWQDCILNYSFQTTLEEANLLPNQLLRIFFSATWSAVIVVKPLLFIMKL